MHNAVIVGALERITDGWHDAQRFLWSEAFRLQKLPQVHTIYELHEQVVNVVETSGLI